MSSASRKIAALRNFGVIAHIDAGKTTLTERILYYSGKIHRMGEVHDGTATMDYMPEEQERGITIASAVTSCPWQSCMFNIIDTPGHVDFTIEVERALRVLDGVVAVFCGVSGVEPQSETVWKQSEKFGVPKIAFVNKMDRAGADFVAVLGSMRKRLSAKPLVLTCPDGEGDDFRGVFDLVTSEHLSFESKDDGSDVIRRPMTAEEETRTSAWRDELIETAGDIDEGLLETYLSGEQVDPQALRKAVRELTLKHSYVPVFAGTALHNSGVQPVMDGVCHYLPSPKDPSAGQELAGVHGITPGSGKKIFIETRSKAPFAGLIFKVLIDAGHPIAFVRIYSGVLDGGARILNSAQGKKERAAHLYRMHADHREALERAEAGDIVAVGGLKFARTGDSLCSEEHPILLEKIDSYRPVLSLAVEPENVVEAEKLREILGRYLLEDPTLSLEEDKDTGQLVLSGMGELHLEVVLDRLKREYRLEPRSGRPQVVYQETVGKAAEGFGEFSRELGGIMHFGAVSLSVEPRERGKGNIVYYGADPEISQEWKDAVQEGVLDALQSGIVRGYPVQDVRVTITDVSVRPGESSQAGYRMSASMALREALAAAGAQLLEPIMVLEVSVPDEFVGDVISLLGATGAKVENMKDRAGQKAVEAVAPLSRLFGFSTRLRSATQGRAGFVMQFERFDVLN